uniref:Uncharacterized protein n=1 Tax=Haptolina ericina TaxID=156174 RepID=A0A7S3FDX2_9EUKA
MVDAKLSTAAQCGNSKSSLGTLLGDASIDANALHSMTRPYWVCFCDETEPATVAFCSSVHRDLPAPAPSVLAVCADRVHQKYRLRYSRPSRGQRTTRLQPPSQLRQGTLAHPRQRGFVQWCMASREKSGSGAPPHASTV